MARFDIPPEFQDKLKPIQPQETRTDEEIVASLKQHHPITSEKNIWAYWHSGIDGLPEWCLRNVIDWVRICGPEWTVRVLDTVPGSPNHALEFAPKEMLPKTFVEGTMTGPYTGPHSADFVRGALLFTHGGVNMDVGCILVRSVDRICWSKLEDPGCPWEVYIPVMYDQYAANHAVASRKGNPFIKRWHDLFIYLWNDRTTPEGLTDSPLLEFVKDVSLNEATEQNFDWDWKVSALTVMEYITQVNCWRRLTMLEGTESDPFSGLDYWMNNIMTVPVREENWPGETIMGFNAFGPRFYNLLQLPLSTDPESEEYKEAHRVVWSILAEGSMQKITRGKHLTVSKMAGAWFDENPGSTSKPGTFGELLRYGAIHFQQTREEIVVMAPPRPKKTMKKELFEP